MKASRQHGIAAIVVLLAVGVVAAFLFAATVAGAVALRAKTDPRARATLAAIPVLGAPLAAMLPPPPAPPPGPDGAAQPAGEGQPAGDSAAPAAAAPAAAAPKPPPESAPPTDLIRHIQQERQFNLVRSKEIADRQERLNVLRDEIERQKTELDNVRKALDERWVKLEKEKTEMEQKAVEIKAQEGKNLKQIAATYERMKPSAAAAALESLDVVTATKILAVMDTSKSGKIIEQMQPKSAASVTERLMKLRRESGAAGSGS